MTDSQEMDAERERLLKVVDRLRARNAEDRAERRECSSALSSVKTDARHDPMAPELRAAFERVWLQNEAGFRYLANHD
jgi:hypothetical protein